MSFQAEKRYVNKSNGRIKENILKQDASDIPKRLRNFQSFKKLFDNKRNYEYTFQGYRILINISYAFEHFEKNTYFDHRSHLNGTLYDILHDPLIVVIDGKKETLTFYKPYKSKDNIFHMLMYQAVKGDDDLYRFKTIYQASSILKIEHLIKATDNNTIYFKYD